MDKYKVPEGKQHLLNFDQIKRTDDGLYTCTANNSAGTTSDKEILVVRCESGFFNIKSLLQTLDLISFTKITP